MPLGTASEIHLVSPVMGSALCEIPAGKWLFVFSAAEERKTKNLPTQQTALRVRAVL